MATKKKNKSAETRKANREKAAAKKQLWAIILFGAGILLGAMTFIEGQVVWKWFHDVLFGLFGMGTFLVAPILIYIAILATLDRPGTRIGLKVLQAALVVTLFCGTMQIFFGINDVDGVWPTIVSLFKTGVDCKGGGLAAGILGVPLLNLFGKIPAAITMILLIFLFLMIITGSTLIGLYHSAKKPVEKLGEVYREKVVERRTAPRFNIDVPMDEAPLPPVSEPMQDTAAIQDNQAIKKAKNRLFNSLRSEPPAANPELEPVKAPAAPTTPQVSNLTVPHSAKMPSVVTDDPEDQTEKNPYIDDLISRALTPDYTDPEEPDMITRKAETDLQADTAPGNMNLQQEHLPEEGGIKTVEYVFPPVTLLNEPVQPKGGDVTDELKQNATKLVDTLKSFGVQTRVIDISRGPAVTRYELQPSAGVKISKITGLADDIALNLAAAGVRIEAPIPNKPAVGIEVPNKVVSTVSFREIIDSNEFVDAKSKLTVAFGRDIAGNIAVADLAKMPHMLIAGATGSGKSVCINSIIMSILYKATPDEVKLIMVDPKVVELGVYNGIPHLMVPVVTDPKKAAGALCWAVTEMLNRYKMFAATGVRDIAGYNNFVSGKPDMKPMPQIVIIIDELADLMMAAPNEVEDYICRLAQMARAAGMHLVIATQRPSVDVITGVIKANIPSRVAFAVSSQVDSRTILDMGGAEKLLGRGDMLFAPVGSVKPLRVQGCFVTDHEVESVTAFIKENFAASYDQQVIDEIEKQAVQEKSDKSGDGGGFAEEDDMLPSAIECVIEAGQASTSLLQRRLKLGYARAARLMDDMESKGIIGPFEGSKPRQVLISRDRWIEMKLNQQAESQQTISQ